MAKLYGSVNGETKEINKLYGSVHKIITRYIVTGFDNRLPQYFNSTTFNNRYIAQYGDMEVLPSSLRVITSGGYSTARLVFQDSTHIDMFHWPEGSYTTQGNEWGFLTLSPVDGAAYSTPQTQQKDVATRIRKLYGSVNGETKLIYEDTNA